MLLTLTTLPLIRRVFLRSEEHTFELQSQSNLVCRLLLEKKKHTSELQSQSNLVCRLLLEKKKKRNAITKQYIYRSHEQSMNSASQYTYHVSSHTTRLLD